jgi:hypothetical protein
MGKEKKPKVDIDSVHEKLADHYQIKRDVHTKASSSIKDFKSVSNTIMKLEKIIDKGESLAKKDKEYNDYLISIRKNIEDQKYQLFQLKLSNGESNIINLLLNINDDSTANDFVAIEREINKYRDLVMDLEPESKLSDEYKLLWDEHYSTIENHFDNLKLKKIHCSVIASKNRVEEAKEEFENKLNKASETLVTADITITKKSLTKLKLIIDEANLTGQKDEAYGKYLDHQKSKLSEYKKEIESVRLKIDINKHRKMIEKAQPSVTEGLELLKKDSGITKKQSTDNQNSDGESLYDYINRRAGDDANNEQNQENIDESSDQLDENELWDNLENNDPDETPLQRITIDNDEQSIEKIDDENDSNDEQSIQEVDEDGLIVENIDPNNTNQGPRLSAWKVGLGAIVQTSLIIGLIYFSSNNYIELRGINYNLPIQERKLSLITSNTIGEQLIKTKAFDQHYSKKSVVITKLLSSLIPEVANINRLTFNHSKANGNFNLSLYGTIGIAGSNGRRILNQIISDMKKQSLIKDVLLINQKTTKENSILFTIDITT